MREIIMVKRMRRRILRGRGGEDEGGVGMGMMGIKYEGEKDFLRTIRIIRIIRILGIIRFIWIIEMIMKIFREGDGGGGVKEKRRMIRMRGFGKKDL